MEILISARKSWRAGRSSRLCAAGIMAGALILAVLFPAMANAADPVGRILAVKGTVSVTHEGAKTPVPGAKNAQVFLGDRLNTGKSSKVKLLMKDESIVTLGQNSELVVDQFVYAPETNTRKSVMKLAKGMVRNLIAKSFSGLGSVFEVHTPTAVAGAMGTENLVWVFRGSELPTDIAGLGGGATDISRIVLNSQFEGGAYMDYGNPGSIDWVRLAAPGDGAGGGFAGGSHGNGNVLYADNGGEGGGPLNTLGVGISNDTRFGNEFGSVVLNNGFASYAPEGFGPTEPFLLPPGTFNNLIDETELSEGGGEGGDDGNDGGAGGGGEGSGGEGGRGDSGGDPLQEAKNDMNETIGNDPIGGLPGDIPGGTPPPPDFGPPNLNPPGGDPDNPVPNATDPNNPASGETASSSGDTSTTDLLPGFDSTASIFNPNPDALFADGFESGILNEVAWSGTNVGVVPGYGSMLPAGGTEMAVVHNGPGSYGMLTLVLDMFAGGNFNIVFDYNFTTGEYTGGEIYYNDFFRAYVNTANEDTIQLAYASVNGNTFTPISNIPDTSPGVSSETGWLNSNRVVTLPTGQNSLNFGVWDYGDTIVDSAVFLDNIQVIPTADPANAFGNQQPAISFTVLESQPALAGTPMEFTQPQGR